MLQSFKRYTALFTLLLLAVFSHAQSPDKHIHITEAANEITGIAKIIASQTGFRYSLNMQNGSLRKKITLKPGDYTLNRILTEIKVQAKLSYKIVGNHIIFVDYVIKDNSKAVPQVHMQAKRSSVPGIKKSLPTISATHTSTDTIIPYINSQVSLPVADEAMDSIKTDTSNSKPPIQTDTIIPAQAPKLNSPSRDSLYRALLKLEPKSNPAVSKEHKQLFFIKTGFAVDEIFYANAVLQGGFKFLYGIASYGSTFKTGGFRWGGGISFPLNEDNRLHINFTTGIMNKTFDVDTFPKLLQLKETLHRFGAAWSKQLNEKVSIQVQLHYNLLLKDYTRDESARKPNPLVGDFDKEYYIIKPPYTLSKTIGTTSVKKSWAGVQCTFFYTIL